MIGYKKLDLSACERTGSLVEISRTERLFHSHSEDENENEST